MTESEGSERAARYSDLFGAADHQHADPSDCAYCPICSVIAVVRKTNPEVLEHLAAAARELIVAAGILLEEAENFVGRTEETVGEPRKKREKPSKVTRIDLG